MWSPCTFCLILQLVSNLVAQHLKQCIYHPGVSVPVGLYIKTGEIQFILTKAYWVSELTGLHRRVNLECIVRWRKLECTR